VAGLAWAEGAAAEEEAEAEGIVEGWRLEGFSEGRWQTKRHTITR
jgi:hypothetical protein